MTKNAVPERTNGGLTIAIVIVTVIGIVAISLFPTIGGVFGPLNDPTGGPGFWLYSVSSIGAYMLVWSAAVHATLLFPLAWPPLSRLGYWW